LIYSTGLPPATIASAIAAVDLIEREPERLALPVAQGSAFTRARLTAGAEFDRAVVIGEAKRRYRLAASRSRRLSRRRNPPPTVPEGTRGLRFFSAVHLMPRSRASRHRPHPHPAQHMTAIFITATYRHRKTFVAAV